MDKDKGVKREWIKIKELKVNKVTQKYQRSKKANGIKGRITMKTINVEGT